MSDSYSNVIIYVHETPKYSAESQKQLCSEWAENNNKEIIAVTESKRECISLLQTNTLVLVYTLECMGKSSKECLNFYNKIKEEHCALMLVKDNINTFRIVVGVHGFDDKEKRTTREVHSKPPYGWKLSQGKGSDLCQVPEEQKIIELIKQLREQSYSYADIAEHLTIYGYKPRAGCKCWYSMTIKRICERENVVTRGSKHISADKSENLSEEPSQASSRTTSRQGSRKASKNPSREQSPNKDLVDVSLQKIIKTMKSRSRKNSPS